MKRGQSKRDGQVWAEIWDERKEILFLVLGQEGGHYKLLCLEDASEDSVLRTALDGNAENWRRVA